MQRLGLENGDLVKIKSKAGHIIIPVAAKAGLMPGTGTVPHGLPHVNVKALISSDRQYIEPASGMHQMNGHPVKIQKQDP